MNAWAVASPCTSPPCVSHPASGSTRPSPEPYRAAPVLRRCAALAATVGGAVAAGAGIADPAALQRYARAVLGALGIGLDATGPLRVPGAETGTLVVANHTSWLDVVAVLAVEPVPLVAKREVAGWPVVGRLARRTGTRFIDREALRELPCFVRDLAAHLHDGNPVALFPQGTTWCAAPGGPFRRAAFQAAIDAGAPVRPVSIGFTQDGRPSSVAAYVGDDTLTASLRRVAAAEGLTAYVRSCPPLWPGGHDRRSLADAAYAAVRGCGDAGAGAVADAVADADAGARQPPTPAEPVGPLAAAAAIDENPREGTDTLATRRRSDLHECPGTGTPHSVERCR